MSNFTPKPSHTNHKLTEDKLVQALHQTRPVGSSQHRDELETRLLGLLEAQSQSTDERHPNMQAQARSPYNVIPLRKMRVSPILVATLAMIFLGAGLLFAYGSASPPDKGSNLGQGVGTNTATPIPTVTRVPGDDEFRPTVLPPDTESCPFAAIGTAEDDVTVYALDSTESDELGIFTIGDQFMIIGQNYTGDWFVVQWSDSYVGWVQIPTSENTRFTMINCGEMLDTVQDVDFNDITATLPPTAIPSSTPIGTETTSESCELYLVRTAQLLNETIVYARPDADADVLSTLTEETLIEVIGVNREQAWFVIKLDANYVGWIEIDSDSIQFLGCAQSDVVEIMIDPTAVPPTALPPAKLDITMTSTPIPTTVPTVTPLP